MSETQEIDALLISALYGELTPAEETALEAHLVSHPADKAALAALTSTRESVRASRILQVQLEPPQSVSALLLQEAARRAPKAEKQEGWFARLARSFMLHPAMAAAAMLVVVIGTVTLVQNRKGDHFAETEPVTTEKVSRDDGIVATQPAKPSSDTTLGLNGEGLDQKSNFEAKGGDALAAGSGSPQAGSAAIGGAESGKDNFQVQLADEDDGKRSIEQAAGEKKKVARNIQADAPVAKNKKAGYAKQDGAYMELRSPEPSVKDLEESRAEAAAADSKYARPPADEAEKEAPGFRNPDAVNAVTPGRSGVGQGGAGATSAPAAPRGNASPVAVAKPAAVPDSKPESQTLRKDSVAGPSNVKAPPAPPPPPPTTKTATSGAKTVAPPAPAPAEDKAANDPQLAWAREQHNAIIARVRGGDCKGAAEIAVTLANRDLAYYRQNVASDRAVKDCLAYIDNARERDQEQRAERQKAAKRSLNEPAKKPAANTTSTDSK